MEVYLNGKKLSLKPSQIIGKGGEAEIFKITDDTVLKLFKGPDHPDIQGDPIAERIVREKLEEHQRKLRVFPRGLTPRVIAPQDLACTKDGATVLGYTMPFISGGTELIFYGQKGFRQNVSHEDARDVLLDLHGVVTAVHPRITISDFNDLNVLVVGKECYLIDADSVSFGPFLSRLFTQRFVDPLLCDPRKTELNLIKPHNASSDWYAFAVMVMQSLLFVDPYGGIHLPKDSKKAVKESERALKRVTVFHPEVRYPKPAIPYGTLPDELLQVFHRIFEKDERGIFPAKILQALRWTTCTSCGTSHARSVCPSCAFAAPAAPRQTTVVRGTVTATRIFRTSGQILRASIMNNALAWLYHEGTQFKREDGSNVLNGAIDPHMRYRLQGKRTLFGKDGRVVILEPGESPRIVSVDVYGGRLPIFDTNERGMYWAHNDQLLREGQFGPERIGDVLSNQTLFWVGDSFGFGFYRASKLNIAFVCKTDRGGLNDSVQLPRMQGKLIEATCVFAEDRCWFFTATQEMGKTIHRAQVVRADGLMEASAEAERGDGSWLGTIGGACAIGKMLLVPTDDGIVRVEIDQGKLVQTRTYPDTEPFLDSASKLFAAKKGLYVVTNKDITMLKIA